MILCLDLETTGLNEQTAGILQIGAVWLHSGESFFRQCQPEPDCRIEQEALKVNGTDEAAIFKSGWLLERLAIIEFLGWVRGSQGLNGKVQIAAWNAHFDFRHLQASLTRAQVPQQFRIFAHRLLDIHSILAADRIRKAAPEILRTGSQAFSYCGDEVANCDHASRFLDMPEEERPHNALNGARHARAMLRRLLGDVEAMP